MCKRCKPLPPVVSLEKSCNKLAAAENPFVIDRQFLAGLTTEQASPQAATDQVFSMARGNSIGDELAISP